MQTRTLKLVIAFDGSNYSGWQRQKNAPTIQEEIEKKLSIILNRQTDLHGAGRTDAGVHAKAMTAHFITTKEHPCLSLQKGLNSLLPRDIRITQCAEMEPDFPARFNAKAKIYTYHISTAEIQLPTERLYTYHIPYQLDINAMARCLKIVEGTHDFTSFEAAGSRDTSVTNGRGAVRTILSTGLIKSNQNISITLEGDGFLRYMVRNIVGTLVEVGRKKRSVEGFQAALEAKDRAMGGSTAPSHALFLERVIY